MDEPERDLEDECGSSRHAEEFARTLGSLSPRVSATLEDHLSYHDGLLPIIFLGELGRWYIDSWRRRDENPEEFSEALMVADAIGGKFTEDATLEESIAVGFVEMFTDLSEADRPCADTLPQPLKDEYQRMKSWKPKAPG